VTLARRVPSIWPAHRPGRPEPLAPRQQVTYTCGRGHEFTVTLAAQVAAPETWDCRCGAPAHHRATVSSVPAALDEHERRMEQLLQRRSTAELEQILADRLAEIAGVREVGQL
jgi:hypothetical protein